MKVKYNSHTFDKLSKGFAPGTLLGALHRTPYSTWVVFSEDRYVAPCTKGSLGNLKQRNEQISLHA